MLSKQDTFMPSEKSPNILSKYYVVRAHILSPSSVIEVYIGDDFCGRKRCDDIRSGQKRQAKKKKTSLTHSHTHERIVAF